MSPSDPKAPARPQRRFSALKRPVKRPAPAGSAAEPEDTEPVEDAEPTEVDAAFREAEPSPVAAGPAEAATASPAPPSSGPAASKASDAASKASDAASKASDGARIAKVMARAGLCSRRDAEGWIAEGRVAVNGATITSPALNIGPADTVTVDGYPIDKPERTRLFLFHKTRGLVTTARDPEGRPTVFDVLPGELPRLMTVGRLDINTEGLLLLTNDGGLARLLELPATGWIRRYRVRANGSVDQATLDRLAGGVTVDGVAYAGIAAKLDRVQGANLWLTMGLKEGKNREIKRVLEHLGLAVTRLIRISFGPFQLGELAENGVEEVRTRVLRDQLGSALAKQAGLDFDGPVGEAAPGGAREPDARGPGKRGRAEAGADEPRRLTRRTATADRRGRSVTVERIVTLAPARGADRKGGGGKGEPRGQGRGQARQDPTRWQTRAPADGRAEAERAFGRGEGSPARRFEEAARPASRDNEARSGERPGRSGAPGQMRGGRHDRDERGPSRNFAAEGGGGREAGRRPSRAEGGPPGRTAGDRSARPSGRSGEDRAWSKRDGFKGSGAKADGPKGGRFKGDRPGGDRPGGGRPGGSRPGGGGRPGGKPGGGSRKGR